MTDRNDGRKPGAAPQIDVFHSSAVRYWTRELRCSERELRAAVEAVGCSERALRNELQSRSLQRAQAAMASAPLIGTSPLPADESASASEQ